MSFVDNLLGIVPRLDGSDRTMLDTTHATGAQRLGHHRIRDNFRIGQDRREPHPGPIGPCEQAVVHSERAKTGKIGGMAVGERHDRTVAQDLKICVTVTGYGDRRMTFLA
jgi:hypothetical protein